MKWRNHKLLTFCTVYSVTGGLISATAAMVGSVLPDVLEMRGLIGHRTVTHYLWFWVAGCLFLWSLLRYQEIASLPLYAAFFVVSGGLLHVCQDALSIGGIPIYTPYGTKVGIAVYRTGTYVEEITTLSLISIFGVLSWGRGFLASSHMNSEFSTLVKLFKQF